MWNGKKKAVTFSFDDGVLQDLRAIEILDKYGLKATFNLNSGKFGTKYPYETNGRRVERTIIEPQDVEKTYRNHEVAVHTSGHFNLTELPDSCVTWQVEEDRKALERLTGKEIRCMAYPCGGVNNDARTARVIRNTTKIRFARTIMSTYSFDLQSDLLRYNPTLHFLDARAVELAQEFLAMQTETPKVFYIWGHTYELDGSVNGWERFETLCGLLAKKEDIYYGTNSEVVLCK